MPRSLPILLLSLVACRPAPRDVEIVATNYAFQAPATVGGGPTIFHFTNRGTVVHEVQLFRFRPGVGADSGLRLLAADGVPDSLFDVNGSVLISAPGQSALEGGYVDLKAAYTWAHDRPLPGRRRPPRRDKLGMLKVMRVQE